MLHAVRIRGGRASYCNRFVRTSRLAQERRAGWAVATKSELVWAAPRDELGGRAGPRGRRSQTLPSGGVTKPMCPTASRRMHLQSATTVATQRWATCC